MIVSVLATLVAAPLSGLFDMSFGALLLTAVSAAPLAPIFALLLASLAQNKVQGFALAKVAGVVLIPPMFAYFITASWQIILGIFPTYWPAMTLWNAQAQDPMFWFYLSIGLVYQIIFLALLTRRFNKIMQR